MLDAWRFGRLPVYCCSLLELDPLLASQSVLPRCCLHAARCGGSARPHLPITLPRSADGDNKAVDSGEDFSKWPTSWCQ